MRKALFCVMCVPCVIGMIVACFGFVLMESVEKTETPVICVMGRWGKNFFDGLDDVISAYEQWSFPKRNWVRRI